MGCFPLLLPASFALFSTVLSPSFANIRNIPILFIAVSCNPFLQKGKYSNNDSDCMDCEAGFKCPGGTDRVPCPPGSARDEKGETTAESRSKCEACTAGKYQPDERKATCIDCPTGFFCPKSSAAPIKCGNSALYCPSSSSIVNAASSGYYTVPEVDTDEGKLVREGQQECEGELNLCHDFLCFDWFL